MKPIVEACIPLYGSNARFRVYLRIREYLRKHRMRFLGTSLKMHLQKVYGCELSINAQISPKASFMHTVGVVIGEGVVVVEGTIIYSGVVLGRKNIAVEDDYPRIEKNVLLSTGCAVLGKCTIHEGCVIGAHSLMLEDGAPQATYVGTPARRIK